MVSDRKKRFLEFKKIAGGSVKDIVEMKKNSPYRVYFDSTGKIKYFGNQQIDVDPEWLTYDFTQEQLSVLKEGKIQEYVIVKDKLLDNLYSIQVKTQEIKKRKQRHLEEIQVSDQNADIICELYTDKISFKMSRALKNKVGNNPIGTKYVTFYVTAKGDPHWLFRRIVIPTQALLNKKISVKDDFGDERENLSVYTKKVFDSYALKML